MGHIEWVNYKGEFPKPGYYLVKFNYKEYPSEEDYAFFSKYSDGYVVMDHHTGRGKCCITEDEVIITGYLFLCEIDF